MYSVKASCMCVVYAGMCVSMRMPQVDVGKPRRGESLACHAACKSGSEFLGSSVCELEPTPERTSVEAAARAPGYDLSPTLLYVGPIK